MIFLIINNLQYSEISAIKKKEKKYKEEIMNLKFLVAYIRTNTCYSYFLILQLLAGLALLTYVKLFCITI